MKVTGLYYEDENFVNLFSGNTMYTLAQNSSSRWGGISAGGKNALGQTVTQEVIDGWLERAMEEEFVCKGTFELDDDGWRWLCDESF